MTPDNLYYLIGLPYAAFITLSLFMWAWFGGPRAVWTLSWCGYLHAAVMATICLTSKQTFLFWIWTIYAVVCAMAFCYIWYKIGRTPKRRKYEQRRPVVQWVCDGCGNPTLDPTTRKDGLLVCPDCVTTPSK